MSTYFERGNAEENSSRTAGEVWSLSWHESPTSPLGVSQGSSGICLTDCGQIVLVSQDGIEWDFPGGRPEGSESLEQTLRREMLEEACARIISASLLGFARAECKTGVELGRIIVRSFWRAEVKLLNWEPQFEMKHRRLVWPTATLTQTPKRFESVYRRILWAAGYPAI